MDGKERDEILYRLDERTKRVDDYLARLDERVEELERTTDSHADRISENEDQLKTARRALGGVGSTMLAAITGAAAKLVGILKI